MNELRACPFCGSEDVHMVWDTDTETYFVSCRGCEAIVCQYHAVKDEAIEAWNKRKNTIAKMFCINCGEILPKGSQAKYCDSCRKEIRRRMQKDNNITDLARLANLKKGEKKRSRKWVWIGDNEDRKR